MTVVLWYYLVKRRRKSEGGLCLASFALFAIDWQLYGGIGSFQWLMKILWRLL